MGADDEARRRGALARGTRSTRAVVRQADGWRRGGLRTESDRPHPGLHSGARLPRRRDRRAARHPRGGTLDSRTADGGIQARGRAPERTALQSSWSGCHRRNLDRGVDGGSDMVSAPLVKGIVAIFILIAVGFGSPEPTPSSASTPTQPTPQPTPTPTSSPIRVLMVTTTLGFRHDSIPTARQVVASLASRSGAFTVTATENVAELTADRLTTVDVLMFALTTGELPLDASQKSAILNFVNNGGGCIGAHSATDTLYGWPDYGRLVGAYFKEHPWTQEATVAVEDTAHPISSGLGASFRLLEEYYTFRENPRPSVHVLLSLNAASVGASGDYPLAWTQTIGRGRSYYNALGHFSETWNDARFQNQIANAIRWVSGR